MARSKHPAAVKKASKISLGQPSLRRASAPDYVVGIGGSAGALEAFEQFFSHMPESSGIAFVLVPHLDPTHKGMMPELLKRSTTIPVFEASDGLTVRRNCIYIVPPNREMLIARGKLQLSEFTAPRGSRNPIDFFFRHLAEDQESRAVAILMSGMGNTVSWA